MKLELRGITKRFGSLVANDNVNLVAQPGQIHCLLGENGAGKSTLMNVLYGLYQPDGGEILLDDKVVKFSGPGDAMAAGIGMVHQHFMLIPVFTVAENVILGHEPVKAGGLLDLDAARAKVREVSARFGFDIDPDAIVGDLPVGVQQRVEIVKALIGDAKVLIFDEPTAVLTPQETDELMAIMKQLRDAGTAIVFITHKLREVSEVADKITVIRLGKVVGEASPTSTANEMASMMVGRAVDLDVQKSAPKLGAASFKVQGLSAWDHHGTQVLSDINLEIREGEILVIAGVQGNGQTELTEAIIGMHGKTAGSIELDGRELLGKSVKQVLDLGVGFVPEDRTEDGLVADFTIAENLMLDRSDRRPFAKGINLQLGVLRKFAEEKLKEFDIRAQGIESLAIQLSGGNQQKVVLARELSRELRLLVASQPTRGLDVGSIEFVHEQIVATRDKGIPVLIVATELDEATQLGDRIAVMYRGKIVGIVPADTPRSVLGQMMAGISQKEVAA
ncbi:MAG: ABC transporter ATP-binding protein [Actinomycetales bacterium]|nr:ABC transporter ATP-binding protein [Actinomycetales bacterium]